MKRYYNNTTGEWYNEGQTMTRSTEDSLFSGVPTEEQLTEWGFEEWVEPVPPEPTPAELLERAKITKIAELTAYDLSDAVNSFTLGQRIMWLTVDEREQLKAQIEACEAKGRETMTQHYDDVPCTFPVAAWKSMLTDLILYAGDAKNVTDGHRAAINALTTIEAVEAYDFTTGYPAKLNF